jgi:hypothetical protein|tara:strand:- start:9847 stop:9984 length:138 start_codon:yes stop_codon:yes gene_type:complete
MKQLTPLGILGGIVLLLLAIASTALIHNLRSQQVETAQSTTETAP